MASKKRKSAKIKRKLTTARPHVVVVGAGAFGGWTALQLLELGARVTLVDSWGAGHLRGTSNDESRIIRCGYGGKDVYSRWAWRARTLWQRYERAWRTQLFIPSGVLWLIADKLITGQGLAGRPALLLSTLLVVLGLQLFALGLLGELIIFTHARAIKDYQIERVIQFRSHDDAALLLQSRD